MPDLPLEPEDTPLEQQDFSGASLPVRQRLPDTRRSVTHKFNISGHEGYITVGLFADGRPGELFLKMAKEGSTLSGLADTIGVLTSIALQYGVPVETLAQKFERVKFEPSGWTQNPEIRHAHSVVDYVFRWLGMQFSQAYRERSANPSASTGNESSATAATIASIQTNPPD